MKDKKIKIPKVEEIKYEGIIEPLKNRTSFYMVVVEDSIYPPKEKHETYDIAFNEALRLSKKENKKAYILKSVAQVEQIPNVTLFNH